MSNVKQLKKRNWIVPSYKFELDLPGGEKLPLSLCFDFNALFLAEAHSGLSALNGSIFRNTSATVVSILLWSALQRDHADDFEGLDGLKVVRSFQTMANLAQISRAVQEAYLATLSPDVREAIEKAAADEAANEGGKKEGESPLARAAK